jgi:hypothetical protein
MALISISSGLCIDFFNFFFRILYLLPVTVFTLYLFILLFLFYLYYLLTLRLLVHLLGCDDEQLEVDDNSKRTKGKACESGCTHVIADRPFLQPACSAPCLILA